MVNISFKKFLINVLHTVYDNIPVSNRARQRIHKIINEDRKRYN